MTDAVLWQDRIIKLDRKPASQFQAHPNNWRKHPMRQRSAVRGSLDSLGWVDVVIENQRTGHVIDGHERIWNALKNEDAEVPYILVDLDEAEEAQALLSLDAIAAMAQTDAEQVDALLRQVQTDNEQVMEFLADFAQESGLDWGQEEQQEAPEAQTDRAEELRQKWGTETGQLWVIPSKHGGIHKLICGDCTDAEVVARVMGGEKADMTFIDPPFNALKSWNKDEAHSETRLDPAGWFANDNLEWNEYWGFIDKLFSNALQGHSVYVCCDFRIYPGIKPAIESKGYKTKHCIVWKKNVWGLGKRYRFQHEFIVYATYKDAPFYGGRDQSDVWELDIVKTTDHKTPKPPELPEKAIANSSQKGDVVFDGCVGHGTTLIACERLARRCRAIEISPAYIAVTLERAAAMGLEPQLVKA